MLSKKSSIYVWGFFFNVNFILIALLITQSAHEEYSSVNDINDIYSVDDLKHSFDTRWKNFDVL